MPPNRFESEVESFLEGSHGDRTHIKRADHHTVTPLCGTLLSRERKSRLKTSAIAALVCLLCCGITVTMYWLFGQPSLKEIVFSPTEGSKLELSMNLTLAIPVVAAALSGAGAYGKVINPSELEVDRQQHRRNAYMVARQRGLTERDWCEVVEAAKQR